MKANNHGKPESPSLSIIICTYNRADLLLLTLEAVAVLPGIEDTEVLVIDNNSRDHTEEMTRKFILDHEHMKLRYVFESRQGLSAARNSGIRHAQADLVAFLDDDAIPERDWILTITDTFRRVPDVQAMGGVIRPRFETRRPDWLIKPFELPYTIVDLGSRVMEYPGQLHPCGANMAFRKSVFASLSFPLELGRVGSALISGEETWLFNALKKKGSRILYHPAMAVEHFIPASRLTPDWIAKRYYYQGLSNGMNGSGAAAKLRILTLVAAKTIFNAGDSLFARSEGRRLLVSCRWKSLRGTKDALFSRAPLSSTG
ncbi:MAG: glycosyl transferase family protein [Paenibacillaceae bacterium]|jgi:glycosyltransferase involved in cell wall biosynthesis|nr:glycosyl transferase family protein [Paenibacillaceae bacterium]